MKSALPIVCVVATSAPTSTEAPGAKYTPLGLVKNTWPLALMRPKIWLGLASSTRFKVTLLAEGWLKLTCACAPTLKVCQSIAARDVLCVMFITAALWTIVTVLATTCPPVGNCMGAGGSGGAASAAALLARISASATTLPEALLPRPLASSR